MGEPASQTLSRGIRVLELLAERREALTIDELARLLEVHRSVAYRLVRTLEDHGLVTRAATGRVGLGMRLAALAASVAPDLQSAALPELTAVAGELGMTSFLAVREGEECITLTSVEPRHQVAAVVQRPGARHPITAGAPGKVLLAALPEAEWPEPLDERLRRDLAQAAARGYATSRDEVIPTVRAVAVPLRLRGRPGPAAIAVVYVGASAEPAAIAERLERAAAGIRSALEG